MKNLFSVIPLVCLLCFVVACQDRAAMAELEAFKTQAAVEEQNKTLYRIILDELNKGNLEVFDRLFASDYAYFFPSNTQKPLSLEETRELIKMHLKSFPDFNWNIEELFAEKNAVIARVSSRGTFSGEYQGIPPAGEKIESSAIFIVKIENGRVIEEREEVDILNVMQQLGMELKPNETEKK